MKKIIFTFCLALLSITTARADPIPTLQHPTAPECRGAANALASKYSQLIDQVAVIDDVMGVCGLELVFKYDELYAYYVNWHLQQGESPFSVIVARGNRYVLIKTSAATAQDPRYGEVDTLAAVQNQVLDLTPIQFRPASSFIGAYRDSLAIYLGFKTIASIKAFFNDAPRTFDGLTHFTLPGLPSAKIVYELAPEAAAQPFVSISN